VAAAPLTVIVGAGISGLTCAYALKKSGRTVLVLEASARPGGYIETVEENGFLFELGPQSFSATEPLFKLCQELGLLNQLIEAPRGAPRYIVIHGKLVPVPLSPGAFLASSLLSWRTKFSILADIFRTSVPPDMDESVATFVRTRFTPELLDRLVAPFVSGIYAGDPEKLSLQAAFPKIHEAEKVSGSIIRGSMRLAKSKTVTEQTRRPGLYSFQKGNATLTQSLADFLGTAIRYNAKLEQEIRRDGDCFVLKIESNRDSEEIRAEKLVLATPAGVNANLLRLIAPAATVPSSDIEYAPVTVASHGYRKDQVGTPLRGFGFLIPRNEKMQTLGTVWNSSLFAGRAPADHVLMTSFVGACKSNSGERLSEAESAEIVRREVGHLFRLSGSPVIERVTNHRTAIPQYNIGHTQRLQTIREAAARVPGLWLTGNYWKGPAIGTCIEHALAVAEEIRVS
jgi:protoporphyrinogen/coproporphyrinogen III oxidase